MWKVLLWSLTWICALGLIAVVSCPLGMKPLEPADVEEKDDNSVVVKSDTAPTMLRGLQLPTIIGRVILYVVKEQNGPEEPYEVGPNGDAKQYEPTDLPETVVADYSVIIRPVNPDSKITAEQVEGEICGEGDFL